jgi:3-methylcrotonyl-CoA carboxylase alpha subunit
MTTSHIGERLEDLTEAPQPSELLLQEAAEHFIESRWNDADDYHHRTLRFDRGLTGFRLNRDPSYQVAMLAQGEPIIVDFDMSLYDGGTHWEPSVGSSKDANEATLFEGGAAFDFALERRGSVGAVADGAILAPMPGKVTSVEVSQGEKVAKGQRLLTLEAMKMEHGLVAPFDGVVAELNAKAGAQVQVDTVLAVVAPDAK